MINRRRYASWSDKVTRKTLVIPFSFFAVFCVVTFNLDASWYTSYFATINRWILAFDGNAQTWVNISVTFREKMILAYLVFQALYVYVFVKSIKYTYQHRYFLRRLIFLRAKSKNVDLVAETILLGIVVSLVFALFYDGIGSGSTIWMGKEDLNNSQSLWIFTDYARWNSIFGFLINKFVEIGMVWISILLSSLSVATVFVRLFKREG